MLADGNHPLPLFGAALINVVAVRHVAAARTSRHGDKSKS